MNYTKGEWKVHIDKDRLPPKDKSFWSIFIVGQNQPDRAIACVYGDGDGTLKANAHLISAAPEMYLALKAIANLYGAINGMTIEWDMVLKALAKAEGKGEN